MRLRRATPADASLLEHWDRQPHVMSAGGDNDQYDDWDWAVELARDVDWRDFLIAEHDGRPIGFLQIIDAAREETHYWGEAKPDLQAIDIWIGEADDLGRGYGSAMMRLAIRHCFADPRVKAILIDPLHENVRAQAFYRRHGFRDVRVRRFGEDTCLVMRLDRPPAAAIL